MIRNRGNDPADDEDGGAATTDQESQGLLHAHRSTGASSTTSPTLPTRSSSSSGSSSTTTSSFLTPRTQKLVLALLAMAVLAYQFLADHVYLWMMTTEVTTLLNPASRRSCAYEGLDVPFDVAISPPSSKSRPSVALVAVMDKRPPSSPSSSSSSSQEDFSSSTSSSSNSNTPAFKRLSTTLMADSLSQQEAYAHFWNYTHFLWEADIPTHRHLLGSRPVAWGKLLALQDALKTHDYALYLDLDLALVQPMLPLDGFISVLEKAGKDLLVAQDGNGVNTGVMLFKKSAWSQWFLSELWRVGETLVDCDCIFYYEQRAFHHALQTEQWRKGYKWWTRFIPIIGWFRNSLRGHPPGPTLEDLPLYLHEDEDNKENTHTKSKIFGTWR